MILATGLNEKKLELKRYKQLYGLLVSTEK